MNGTEKRRKQNADYRKRKRERNAVESRLVRGKEHIHLREKGAPMTLAEYRDTDNDRSRPETGGNVAKRRGFNAGLPVVEETDWV